MKKIDRRHVEECSGCGKAHSLIFVRLKEEKELNDMVVNHVGTCRNSGQKVFAYLEPEPMEEVELELVAETPAQPLVLKDGNGVVIGELVIGTNLKPVPFPDGLAEKIGLEAE